MESGTDNLQHPHFWDYLLVSLIVMGSGFLPFFGLFYKYTFVIIPLLLILGFARKWNHAGGALGKLLFASLLLLVMQTIKMNGDFLTMFSIMVRLGCYCMIGVIVGRRFSAAFDSIMLFICVTSIIFWGSINLFPSVHGILLNIADYFPQMLSDEYMDSTSNPAKTIWIYTVSLDENLRNNGPFFEPGMFAVFIVFALLNRLYIDKTFSFRLAVYILALSSTLSTAGICAGAWGIGTFFLFSLSGKKDNSLRKVFCLLLLTVIVLAANYYFSSDLIRTKITDDISNSEMSYSRFGSILYHWDFIVQNPLLGIGYQGEAESDLYVGCAPNGISNIIRILGIPFSILYYILLWRGLRNSMGPYPGLTRLLTSTCFISLLLVAFGQDITTRPFCYMLLGLGCFCYPRDLPEPPQPTQNTPSEAV